MFDRNKPYNDLPELPISEEIIDTEILKKMGNNLSCISRAQ